MAFVLKLFFLTSALLKLEDVGVLEEVRVFDADTDEGSAVAGVVLSVEGLHHCRLVLPDLK